MQPDLRAVLPLARAMLLQHALTLASDPALLTGDEVACLTLRAPARHGDAQGSVRPDTQDVAPRPRRSHELDRRQTEGWRPGSARAAEASRESRHQPPDDRTAAAAAAWRDASDHTSPLRQLRARRRRGAASGRLAKTSEEPGGQGEAICRSTSGRPLSPRLTRRTRRQLHHPPHQEIAHAVAQERARAPPAPWRRCPRHSALSGRRSVSARSITAETTSVGTPRRAVASTTRLKAASAAP